jgi:hypothetical protein
MMKCGPAGRKLRQMISAGLSQARLINHFKARQPGTRRLPRPMYPISFCRFSRYCPSSFPEGSAVEGLSPIYRTNVTSPN